MCALYSQEISTRSSQTLLQQVVASCMNTKWKDWTGYASLGLKAPTPSWLMRWVLARLFRLLPSCIHSGRRYVSFTVWHLFMTVMVWALKIRFGGNIIICDHPQTMSSLVSSGSLSRSIFGQCPIVHNHQLGKRIWILGPWYVRCYLRWW